MSQLLPPNTLTGVRLGVSASGSADLQRLGLLEDHFRLALGELARTVLILGGALQYCGHLDSTGYTAFLIGEVRRYGRASGSLSVLLALPVHRRISLGEIKRSEQDIGLFGSISCLDLYGERVDCRTDRANTPATLSRDEIEAALTAMRRIAAHEAKGRLLIGGRRTGYQGSMPGVLEEALLALSLGQPLFLAGGFGGVTLDVISQLDPSSSAWLPADSSRDEDPGFRTGFQQLATVIADRGWHALSNGLDPAENAQLAATHRPSEIAALVSLGLGRLAGQRAFFAHEEGTENNK